MSNINLSDLQIFITVARSQSLQTAATELNLTPSALSRTVKRLEQSLNTALFHRIGRQLRLNADGEKLRLRALELMGMVDRTVAEFAGSGSGLTIRLLGPPLLQWRWGSVLADRLAPRYGSISLNLSTEYEQQALDRLRQGEGDLALVTGEALKNNDLSDVCVTTLGPALTVLAAGPTHPLVRAQTLTVLTEQVLALDFVCPRHSLFCGVNRGAASDGWRDDQLPRRIRLWADDLQVLLGWVSAGRALAYLPDFVLPLTGLQRIVVSDCPYICTEDMFLIHRRKTETGWQRFLADTPDFSAL